MAYETLVAVYNSRDHALRAIEALKAAGFAAADISLFDKARLKGTNINVPPKIAAPIFWQHLFGTDVHEHEAKVYADAIAADGVIVTVRVLQSEVAHASGILNLHFPADVHDVAITSGFAAPAHAEAVDKMLDDRPLVGEQTVAVSPRVAEAHPEVLQLAEEQLEVGKEMVETGRTRVRRFTTERDVAQDITLHDEHAEVIRRVIGLSPSGKINWADETIEVIETAEHALANKTARIVEEVSLKRVGGEHVETIRDKLRRQQAEVEEIGPDGKPKSR